MSDRCMCGGKIVEKEHGAFILVACEDCGEVFMVNERKMWMDREGNKYTNSEVVFVDIDSPGAQFLGYVTFVSKRNSRCIDDWVEVVRVKV